MNALELRTLQEKVCRKYGQVCMYPDPDSKVGIAIQTHGKLPINALRHPPQGNTNGWYIWYGEEMSRADDFFSPLHTSHLPDRCPEVLPFLGLPPGYRVLLAGNHVDVWYDADLLNV